MKLLNASAAILFYSIIPSTVVHGFGGIKVPSFFQLRRTASDDSSLKKVNLREDQIELDSAVCSLLFNSHDSLVWFFLPRNNKNLKKTSDLLEAISYTGKGKNASPEKQAEVLALVSDIETLAPPSERLLSDSTLAKQLDGVWYVGGWIQCSFGYS